MASLAHDPDGVKGRHEFLGVVGGTMESLVSKVHSLLANPARCREWGRSARAWSIRLHGYDANKNRIVEIFNTVAARGRL